MLFFRQLNLFFVFLIFVNYLDFVRASFENEEVEGDRIHQFNRVVGAREDI